jgi:hypothetical protein
MMSSNSKIISDPLPQEMQQHTYSIMYQVEGAHWWFVGRRKIIESFLAPLCHKLNAERGRTPLADSAIRISDAEDATATPQQAQAVQAIAVCYLFSFVDPRHERRTREICREVAPDMDRTNGYWECPCRALTVQRMLITAK